MIINWACMIINWPRIHKWSGAKPVKTQVAKTEKGIRLPARAGVGRVRRAGRMTGMLEREMNWPVMP
jgi:hypothetical protein